MTLKFEKVQSPIYPAYLRVGEYSIALERELIDSLKEAANNDAPHFLEKLVQKVGSNRYLKEMIQEGLAKNEDQTALARQLTAELQKL